MKTLQAKNGTNFFFIKGGTNIPVPHAGIDESCISTSSQGQTDRQILSAMASGMSKLDKSVGAAGDFLQTRSEDAMNSRYK